MNPAHSGATPANREPPEVKPRSSLLHVVALLGLAVVAAGAIGFGLWFGLGQPDLSASVPAAPAPSGQPTTQTSKRSLTVAERLDGLKIILAVVGGIGAVVALTVAYRRQRHGEIATYRDKRAEAREVTKAFTDRYGKAADLLGGATAAVRLAGVYALAALADDWEDGRQMCIDLLCAYLRMPYDPEPESDGYLVGNREVRRSLLRVIRNHLRPGWTAVSWARCKFSFEGATFDCGDLSGIRLDGDPGAPRDERPNMTFHGARFIGDFDLRNVKFAGTPVWFTKAKFLGDGIQFDEAEFAGSTVDFRKTEWTSGAVSFIGTKYTIGTVTFGGAQFNGADVAFNRAQFSGADVTFDGAERTAGLVTFTDATHTGGTVAWGPFPSLPSSPE